MRAIALLAVALALAAGCGGPKDPLAGVKADYPGADEYITWQKYLLVRWPADEESGDQRAVLLRWEEKAWSEVARSDDGFVRARELMTWIPELDESGVAAFGLHH
ncbi:hypothetical protein JXB37_00810 [candidate division WOR-3 bacterium]|nr:hypothetical protein [candidate division WOR-3 bacterium]